MEARPPAKQAEVSPDVSNFKALVKVLEKKMGGRDLRYHAHQHEAVHKGQHLKVNDQHVNSTYQIEKTNVINYH